MSEATLPALRIFVPADALEEGQLSLTGPAATRAYLRGARAGQRLHALDGRGWGHEIAIEHASWERLEGAVVGRSLAPERRTKVTLHHGLLPPADTRNLVFAASAAGVIAYGPMITDFSVVPDLLSAPGTGPTAVHAESGGVDLAGLALEAAEVAGRGRCPALREPSLFDRALDEAVRAGETIVLAESAPAEADVTLPPTLLERRPFALALLCPPPDGFSEAELARAATRGGSRMAIPRPASAPDAEPPPLRLALAALDALYEALEPEG